MVAHKVGGLLAEKYTIEKLIKDKVDLNLCSQGLLHGFLEGVGKSADTDKLVSVAVKLCGQDEPTGCIHGAGHALADTKNLYHQCRRHLSKVNTQTKGSGKGKITFLILL